MDGKWESGKTTHIYENEWMSVDTVDVTLPDGNHVEHHVMRPQGGKAACVVCFDADKGVLMIWRHRFINDLWGWEFPAGSIESSETVKAGAAREFQEETGWKANEVKSFLKYQPMGGSVACEYECFYTEGAEWVGPGRDINEAADLAWIPLDQLRGFVAKGEVSEGLSLVAALFALQFGPLKDK